MATQTASTSRSHVAPPLDVFEQNTLTRVFFHAIDNRAREDALQFKSGGSWRALSHAEIETRVTRLAAAMQGWGIERGDRVAMLSENRPEWAITDFAALGLGCIDVAVYPTLPANQIAFILNDCGARAIFVSTAEQLAKVQEIRSQVPALERIISYDDPRGPTAWSTSTASSRRGVAASRAAKPTRSVSVPCR
jgi:long-chain acyl-CoA synthetase